MSELANSPRALRDILSNISDEELQAIVEKHTPSSEWREDDNGVWHSSEGNAFCFEEGGPIESGWEFCPYTGKPLKVVGEQTNGSQEAQPNGNSQKSQTLGTSAKQFLDKTAADVKEPLDDR